MKRAWLYRLFLVISLLGGFGQAILADAVLRDPTKPLTAADINVESNNSGLAVMMIRLGGDGAAANVNGKMVKVGDEINGARVVAIASTAVEFQAVDKTKFSVPLHSYIIKHNLSQVKGEQHGNNQ